MSHICNTHVWNSKELVYMDISWFGLIICACKYNRVQQSAICSNILLHTHFTPVLLNIQKLRQINFSCSWKSFIRNCCSNNICWFVTQRISFKLDPIVHFMHTHLPSGDITECNCGAIVCRIYVHASQLSVTRLHIHMELSVRPGQVQLFNYLHLQSWHNNVTPKDTQSLHYKAWAIP